MLQARDCKGVGQNAQMQRYACKRPIQPTSFLDSFCKRRVMLLNSNVCKDHRKNMQCLTGCLKHDSDKQYGPMAGMFSY